MQGNKRRHCIYEKEYDALTFRTIKGQDRPRENFKKLKAEINLINRIV